MDGGMLIVVALVVWLAFGSVTGVWMVRRGHDPLWLLIALALGPLFVPIAAERIERPPRLAVVAPEGPPPCRPPGPGRPRILVGLDGSPESEQALSTALALFQPTFSTLVLAEVVPYDSADESSRSGAGSDRVAAASARLAAIAHRLDDPTVTYEVLAGPPAETLRRFAQEQDMDLLVVGRRGHGVSTRLLGSVSGALVHHCALPVLVPGEGEVEPRPRHASRSRTGDRPAVPAAAEVGKERADPTRADR
jgi:nucleotide-binding universal stress UspA family protein